MDEAQTLVIVRTFKPKTFEDSDQFVLSGAHDQPSSLRAEDAYEQLGSPSSLECRNLSVAETAERDALFRTLVKTHAVRLQRFIVKHIGNPSDAEDLTQQAFLSAVQSFDTFKGQSELSTWLYGIAMNLVRNHLSRAPHRRFEFTDDSELDTLATEAPSPPQILDEAKNLRYLNDAMADLPEAMRDILLMVAVDELSYEEAAALLTVPVGTVRSRLSRARAALRTKFTQKGVILDF